MRSPSRRKFFRIGADQGTPPIPDSSYSEEGDINNRNNLDNDVNNRNSLDNKLNNKNNKLNNTNNNESIRDTSTPDTDTFSWNHLSYSPVTPEESPQQETPRSPSPVRNPPSPSSETSESEIEIEFEYLGPHSPPHSPPQPEPQYEPQPEPEPEPEVIDISDAPTPPPSTPPPPPPRRPREYSLTPREIIVHFARHITEYPISRSPTNNYSYCMDFNAIPPDKPRQQISLLSPTTIIPVVLPNDDFHYRVPAGFFYLYYPPSTVEIREFPSNPPLDSTN